MQIEETFHDLKSPQYGFGLRQSRTNNPKRLDILLQIYLLTFMVYWWFGIAPNMPVGTVTVEIFCYLSHKMCNEKQDKSIVIVIRPTHKLILNTTGKKPILLLSDYIYDEQ